MTPVQVPAKRFRSIVGFNVGREVAGEGSGFMTLCFGVGEGFGRSVISWIGAGTRCKGMKNSPRNSRTWDQRFHIDLFMAA
jgi:hypothetical protein